MLTAHEEEALPRVGNTAAALSSWPRPCVSPTSSTILFFQMRMYSFLVTKHILC